MGRVPLSSARGKYEQIERVGFCRPASPSAVLRHIAFYAGVFSAKCDDSLQGAYKMNDRSVPSKAVAPRPAWRVGSGLAEQFQLSQLLCLRAEYGVAWKPRTPYV